MDAAARPTTATTATIATALTATAIADTFPLMVLKGDFISLVLLESVANAPYGNDAFLSERRVDLLS